jgi:glycosyltransferase involved in cell wall biosynthesis
MTEFNNGKKTILLLSDDFRMHSGIATMSREIILGTIHKYNWIQVGAAINHPEVGKILDVSDDIKNTTGIQDSACIIYPYNGYGDADLIRMLLNRHKIDGILHFTDPRYWVWLYEIEHEVRQQVPLMFYHIWDDLPDPEYNRNFYESCDWIGCISKQTYGITKRVGKLTNGKTWQPREDWQVKYVQHGVSPAYKPLIETEISQEIKKRVYEGNQYDFVIFWSSRNIRRKQPSDVIWAYKMFCDKLTEEQKKKCLLLMHTQKVDHNGTDLPAVIGKIAPDVNIKFSENSMPIEMINEMINLSDISINICGNEGFGLTTAEATMAGLPSILLVTGGLQDQCGFRWKDTGELLTEEDYFRIGSLHDWRKFEDKVESGEWVKPLWARAQTMQGSVPTPYIIDDKVDVYELADAIKYWYDIPKEERKLKGLKGREYFLSENGFYAKKMCEKILDGIETTFQKWKPRKRFDLFKVL